MQTPQRYKTLILFMGLLLLLAGCGVPGLASTPPTLPQMLQSSTAAMSHLNSAHIELQANVNIQASTSTASPSTDGFTFNLSGHGDVASPDKVSIDLSLGSAQLLSLISVGPKVYIRGKDGSWYFLEKSKIENEAQNFFSQSLTQRMGQILLLAQNAKLSDHGQESLNGETLEHITATLDDKALQGLSAQLNGLLSADIQQQLQQAALDLWVDPSTWYVHQAILNVVANVDASKLSILSGQKAQGSSASVPVSLKLQLNFSKLNEPVDIQAPTNATAFP